ncbi:hypothetical protein V5799_032624 [Amblyomma americanum]|uniref:Peptidase S54 rhomboid domain-containing protein n=1 Tax=Amblyomma americanum TaxID=6943 RepID=A0AAQ4DQM6_AMBAM
MQRRRQRDTMGVLLLLNHVLFQVGLDAIPPVTLLTVAAQACVFLQVFDLPWYDLSGACMSVDNVLFKKQWWRVFYGTFEHGDSLHLYYNMVSFIWKGMVLESVLGSAQFLYIILLFTVLCGGTFVGINYLLGAFIDSSFYYQCAVGFSGVIFALKVLNNYYFPGRSRRILGLDINLPSGQVVWVELLFIQLITPNASFVGHLAGILVGLAYVYDIIKPISDLIWSILGQEPMRFAQPQYVRRGRDLPASIPLGAVLLSATLLALQSNFVPDHLKQLVNSPCLASSLVIGYGQWKLLFLPALHTAGSLHLAYTVLSLLGLGYYLERRMGSLRFLGAVAGLAVITNIAFCLLTYYVLPNYKEVAGVHAYEMHYKCFLGLTAAVMAMKGLYSVYYPHNHYLFLFFLVPVPKLLGAIFEVAVLYFALPHIWIVGNVIGTGTGLLLFLVSRGPHY